MTEKELQQYLLLNYPKEDERCEWKEFKNLKNDFNGKEKDDVISYVSALANMEGGHLVIGVVDKTLEIVGTDTYNYNVEKACLRLKYYRNYCLCQGMVSFNMIDTIGHGIEKIFSEQKRRKCFPPEYTIDNEAKEVSVKVYARDYHDAEDSFMTSEKNIERHNNVIKASGKRQERINNYTRTYAISHA